MTVDFMYNISRGQYLLKVQYCPLFISVMRSTLYDFYIVFVYSENDSVFFINTKMNCVLDNFNETLRAFFTKQGR